MRKRILAALAALLLLTGLCLPALAAETEEAEGRTLSIYTIKSFLQFAEDCRLDSYSQGLTVILKRDIRLDDTDFQRIPIFHGVFQGNGHTIAGVNITEESSALGLFRYLEEDAIVEDLHVTGSILPEGSRSQIGAIAGVNRGTIRNCSFSGTVSGNNSIGGLVGTNAVTGIIEGCTATGQVNGSHFVGGICGDNSGVIRDCVNQALVNSTAQHNTVKIEDITLESITNTEAPNTVTDVGGIAGTSSGVIRGCENREIVGYLHMGYNIGGIVGTQSGYVVDSHNYSSVYGRKEVGGIAGQMEPVSLIEFTEDTLQILQGQLNSMAGMVNKASGNAQSNAGEVMGQIGVLYSQAETARDAVNSLLPDESGNLPDADALNAARNTLTSTLDSMPGTLNSITAATQSTVNGLSRDLQAISAQINTMSSTISNASENLGGAILDVSDDDDASTLTGKVESCTNYGTIYADLNVGGIAGAIALENDMELLENLQQSGDESMNFQNEVRAVILNCRNGGIVTDGKQNMGGITGWQSLGLVKGCINIGFIDGENAQYVGGIAGLSTGYLRGNYTKCEISGASNVGGIAGSASIATDCVTMVTLSCQGEKHGAVLGARTETQIQEEEDPVANNLYFCSGKDPGAIDGISYANVAEPVELEVLLSKEDLPEIFRQVTIRFRFENGSEARVHLDPGEDLTKAQIPVLPEKDGATGRWAGLEEADTEGVLFDMTFQAEYIYFIPTIQSEMLDADGRPQALATGSFTHTAEIILAECDDEPATDTGSNLIGCWNVSLPEADTAHTLRISAPDAEGNYMLLLHQEDGSWQTIDSHMTGSYVVTDWNLESAQIALVEVKETSWWIYILAGVLAVGVSGYLLFRKKKS